MAVPDVGTLNATGIDWDNGTFHAQLNGIIYVAGDCFERGFVWGFVPDYYVSEWHETGSFGTGTFNHVISGLSQKVYYRAYAENSDGKGYGDEKSFDPPPPDPPTNVAATDGIWTGYVKVTWTKSSGATDYQVYRDGTPLGWLGDVDEYNDTGADMPYIVGGDAHASDGDHITHVFVYVSGHSVNNGTTHTYKVKAKNAGGESGYSDTDTGYRGHGALEYQWWRSAGDSDSNYSSLSGATSSTYSDYGAPENGDGRYYKVVLTAGGCQSAWSSPDRGYRDTPPPPDPPTNVAATDGDHTDKVRITWTKSDGATGYQVYRNGFGLGWLGDVSSHDDAGADAPTITHGSVTASDGDYSTYVRLVNSGASANEGDTHTYKVKARNIGGESGYSGTDTGYRGVGSLTYQWYKSAADSDANYSSISGATSSTYNYTGAPAPSIDPGTATASDGTYEAYVRLTLAGEHTHTGAGRYYKCYHTATGAASGYTGVNRGYRGVGSLTRQWRRSAADSDTNFSNIIGGTTDPYNDTGAPSNGDGRWYYCRCSATGASSQDSTHNRGYRLYVEPVTMIGGPTSWVWGTAVADVSVVQITSDGGKTWVWGVASGTITIPIGGPLGWGWEEIIF